MIRRSCRKGLRRDRCLPPSELDPWGHDVFGPLNRTSQPRANQLGHARLGPEYVMPELLMQLVADEDGGSLHDGNIPYIWLISACGFPKGGRVSMISEPVAQLVPAGPRPTVTINGQGRSISYGSHNWG